MNKGVQLQADRVTLPSGITQATILVVTRDPHGLRWLTEAVQAGGFRLLLAHSPSQGFALVQTQTPDIVLIDALDHSNGLALCHLLKQDERDFLPVILLVADEDEAEEAAANPLVSPDAILIQPELNEVEQWLHSLLRMQARFRAKLRPAHLSHQHFEEWRKNITQRISHELATPLLQVKSAIALLIEDLVTRQYQDEHGITLMATEAVGRLENLINNIRSLSHMDDLLIEPIALPEAANYGIRLLNRKWGAHGTTDRIKNQIPPDLPLVMGDKIAVGHLIQLLLDNALRFSDDNTPVYVLASEEDSGEVRVAVQDFGIGISPSDLKFIFQPFYKVNDTASSHQAGSGTGLALARLLAAGMDTTIEVESISGEGSTFSFCLPVVPRSRLH